MNSSVNRDHVHIDKATVEARPGVSLAELIERGEVGEFHHLCDPEPMRGFMDFVRETNTGA